LPYREFRRKLAASFFAPFIVTMSVLAMIVLWRFQTQATNAKLVEHSDRAIVLAMDTEVQLREVQAALREYLLTIDERYLSDFDDARKKLRMNLTMLAAQVADDPQQEHRVLKIDDLSSTWVKALDSLLRKQVSAELKKRALAATDAQAQAVLNLLDNFVSIERRIRTGRVNVQTREYYLVFVAVPLLSGLIMIFLSYWGWREIAIATNQFREALDNTERARRGAEEARGKAEEANRAKDNFIGTVSHELRTPLNSIALWSAALMRNPSIDEDARRGILAIDRAVKAQAQLVEDLLDISRIESGRMRLDVQPVNLAQVVKAATESMRLAAEAKSITLQDIVDPRVDFISGDSGRLQQVVWNLVSNAVKFTPNGGKIQVRLERINSHVEVVVADSGQGIDPNALDSVFDRFWQAEESSQGRHGVGLGLSIVKEIVALHGGTVVAHSDGPGKGSTFTVRLPLPVSTIPTLARHPTVSGAVSAAKAPRLDGFSVLVVDDDPDACSALDELFRSLGADVKTAPSARLALAALDAFHPDAIVSDIGMPGGDGYFLASELRKREQISGNGRRVLLIALTAYGRLEDKLKILVAGFDSHAVKPVDPVEICTILKTSITTRKASASHKEAE
jgi:signal transduction histidine kinase/ActR/RegA family two-component response regulator